MKQILYLIFSLSTFSALAQQKDSIPCPTIKINGPGNNIVYEGKEAIFSVKSFKKDFMKTHSISYEWVIINGSIIDGKNKNTVYVNTEGLEGEKIKAVVMIKGLDTGCPDTGTITIEVVKPTVKFTEQKIVRRPQ